MKTTTESIYRFVNFVDNDVQTKYYFAKIVKSLIESYDRGDHTLLRSGLVTVKTGISYNFGKDELIDLDFVNPRWLVYYCENYYIAELLTYIQEGCKNYSRTLKGLLINTLGVFLIPFIYKKYFNINYIRRYRKQLATAHCLAVIYVTLKFNYDESEI